MDSLRELGGNHWIFQAALNYTPYLMKRSLVVVCAGKAWTQVLTGY